MKETLPPCWRPVSSVWSRLLVAVPGAAANGRSLRDQPGDRCWHMPVVASGLDVDEQEECLGDGVVHQPHQELEKADVKVRHLRPPILRLMKCSLWAGALSPGGFPPSVSLGGFWRPAFSSAASALIAAVCAVRASCTISADTLATAADSLADATAPSTAAPDWMLASAAARAISAAACASAADSAASWAWTWTAPSATAA